MDADTEPIRHGGAQAEACGHWEYSFAVEPADGAEPALVILCGLMWPGRITMTFRIAQFAAFKKGLERHGLEMSAVTRKPTTDPGQDAAP